MTVRQLLAATSLCLASLTACATAQSSRPTGARPGVARTDRKCPEGPDPVVAAKPAGWTVYGRQARPDALGFDIVYRVPDGSLTTWCQHTERMWQEQRDAVWSGRYPFRDDDDEARKELIRREYQLVHEHKAEELAKKEAQLIAELEASKREQRERWEAQDREREETTRLFREKSDRERSEKATVDLGGLLLAKADPVAVSSVQICVQFGQMAIERERLAREHRIASTGGAIDLLNAHGAAEGIDDAREEAKAITALVRKRYGRQPMPCTGGVKKAAQCLLDGECPDRISKTLDKAWSHTSHLLDGDPIDQREAELLSQQPDTADAEARASEARSVIRGR